MAELINKVELKSIVQIDLEELLPKKDEVIEFDIKRYLFKEFMLKEAEFRASIESYNWSHHKDKYTLIYCSNEAIIPQWAYLLLASKLAAINSTAIFKTERYQEEIILHKIYHLNNEAYQGKRVLIKGCSSTKISLAPYLLLTQILSPIVKSLSFGESCSMIPIFKN